MGGGGAGFVIKLLIIYLYSKSGFLSKQSCVGATYVKLDPADGITYMYIQKYMHLCKSRAGGRRSMYNSLCTLIVKLKKKKPPRLVL